jgi:endonuclease/exonuclease/phosphatase family metal-dependent hydrolase
MKLITWNIQWGLGMDGRLDLARIVAEARRIADFDLLCLQEVADNFPDLPGSPETNQFAEVARLLPGYAAIEGIAVDVPGTAGGRRRFGNMILSRRPVGQVLRHALWGSDETQNMPRTVIEAVIEAPFGPVRVMTTHLEYFSEKLRRSGVEAIRAAHARACARAARPPHPGKGPYGPWPTAASAVLVGDFNMRPEDPAKARVEAPLNGAPAFRDAWQVLHPDEPYPPSFCIADRTYGPPHCCDFIFVTEDLAPRVARIAYETETRASDHQPVLIELQDDRSMGPAAG